MFGRCCRPYAMQAVYCQCLSVEPDHGRVRSVVGLHLPHLQQCHSIECKGSIMMGSYCHTYYMLCNAVSIMFGCKGLSMLGSTCHTYDVPL